MDVTAIASSNPANKGQKGTAVARHDSHDRSDDDAKEEQDRTGVGRPRQCVGGSDAGRRQHEKTHPHCGQVDVSLPHTLGAKWPTIGNDRLSNDEQDNDGHAKANENEQKDPGRRFADEPHLPDFAGWLSVSKAQMR